MSQNDDVSAAGGQGARDEGGGSDLERLLERPIGQLSGRQLAQVLSALGVAGGLHSTGNVGQPHVNSGPPGFENSGGHANFDPKAVGRGGQVFDPSRFASHVNSGPPGFENSGGHANFDPKAVGRGGQVIRVAEEVARLTLPDGGQVTLPAGSFTLEVGGFRLER
jgi:hypothetical protein